MTISNGLCYRLGGYKLQRNSPVVALLATALDEDLVAGGGGVATDPQYKSNDDRPDRDSDRRRQRGMVNSRQAKICGDILDHVGWMVGLPDGLDRWCASVGLDKNSLRRFLSISDQSSGVFYLVVAYLGKMYLTPNLLVVGYFAP